MDLYNKVASQIHDAVEQVCGISSEIQLTVPDERFGDFSTNIAMQLASKLGKKPLDIADEIVAKLNENGQKANIAGPGFINVHGPEEDLWAMASKRSVDVFAGKRFVVEYSCPNYFKELHAGHLYQTLYGDAVARMIENSGAMVFRTNFGADVGLSAARALWGILRYIGGENPEKLADIPENERTKFIATSYIDGARADTSDDTESSEEIATINKKIYAMHASSDTTSPFAVIYFTCRSWCREYFEKLYTELRVHDFDKFYPESSTEARGRELVAEHRGSIFTDSQGAVVYEGEKDGLHTRVFITKEGLPTYETKDLGLIFIEKDEFMFDRRLLITGKEQSEYMKVVWRAADLIQPGINASMTHLTNGLIRFGDGQKMSSRTGNVTTAMDVIGAVKEAVGDSGDQIRDEHIYLGALKYEFLKYKLGGDIAFDPEESVSLHGNSGPYLQYALVRAQSILAKTESIEEIGEITFDESERKIVRALSRYQLVLYEATKNFETHTLTGYLYELASQFNIFYEKCKIIGDPRQNLRLAIVRQYTDTLANGLGLLGITVPDKM